MCPIFQALVSAQDRIAKKIQNFKFNLGFSGYYYKRGSLEENEGDELLIKNKDKFWWFPHTFRHYKPHQAKSLDELVSHMTKNKRFAEVTHVQFSSMQRIVMQFNSIQ